MTIITAAWQRIDGWLSRNALEVAQGLRPGATEEQVATTERALGVMFPEDVRASYRHHDGQASDSLGIPIGGDFLPLEGIVEQWRVWKDLLDSKTFD